MSPNKHVTLDNFKAQYTGVYFYVTSNSCITINSYNNS